MFFSFAQNALSSEKWIKPEFDEKETREFYETVAENGSIKYMNFLCFSELLRRFAEMQRFFCNLPNAGKLLEAKEKLIGLIGMENMLELDEMFPEIMQIGNEEINK